VPGGTVPGGTVPGGTVPGGTMPGGAAAGGAAGGAAAGGGAPGTEPSSAFDLSQARGTEAPSTAAETLLGDLAGGSYFTTVVVIPPASGLSNVATTRLVRVPAVGRGSFKITENESPRPLDRVFINYEYYNHLLTGPASNGDVSTVHPNLHRETFGFEKTLFDSRASFGLRVPLFQTVDSGGALQSSDVGDLTFIGKFAFFDNRSTGNLLSGGLAVTAPTGPDEILADGSRLHSTLLQPYLGYVFTAGQFYLEGFTAVIVPTDSRDVTLFTEDIGVGYHLFDGPRDTFIRQITPTFELHLTDPLDHRGLNNPSGLGFPDILILTTGAHLELSRAILTLGAAVPVTGPKVFDIEAIAQLNWRF
jgi:hypothetical protein